jgi:hypothetical protein
MVRVCTRSYGGVMKESTLQSESAQSETMKTEMETNLRL